MSRVRFVARLALLPAIAVIALLIAWRLGYFDLARREQLFSVVQRARETDGAGLLYLIVYALIAMLGLPVTVLSVVGGALFGAARGFVLAWTGGMLGTLTAYGMARSIGQRPARRLFGRHHLLDRLRKRSDFWTLLRLRLLPLAPFGVLDYVAGLVGASLRALMLATAVGTVPSAAAYAYAGAELVKGLAQTGETRLRAFWIAGVVTTLVTLVSLLPAVTRQLRG
ncbi:MAG: TVP38/TMEM64 family protein [Gemmatimonadaceae bacterium]